VLLHVVAALVREPQEPTPVDLSPLDEALVLELLDGRVDGAGARLPRSAAAVGDLLDDLVPVHLVAGEDVEDGGPDVTAASARSSRARGLLGPERRSAEAADEVVDPRRRARPAATHATPRTFGAAPPAEAGHPVRSAHAPTAASMATRATVSAARPIAAALSVAPLGFVAASHVSSLSSSDFRSVAMHQRYVGNALRTTVFLCSLAGNTPEMLH
jgi:hypothetical protein